MPKKSAGRVPVSVNKKQGCKRSYLFCFWIQLDPNLQALMQAVIGSKTATADDSLMYLHTALKVQISYECHFPEVVRLRQVSPLR